MQMAKIRMVVWNVEAGNAISLEMPSGKVIMIDAGATDDCSPCKTLHNLGFLKIHALIVTHPHEDHIADLPMMRRLRMGPAVLYRPRDLSDQEVLDGNPNQDSESIRSYLALNGEYILPVTKENDILSSSGFEGAVFKQFYTNDYSANDLNNRSRVVVMKYGDTKVLLPGDCTPAAMRSLLAQGDFRGAILGTTILLSPHHGRKSCCCDELMGKIHPTLTIISDGKYRDGQCATNYYNNHTVGVLYRLKANNSVELRRCLTTRNDGLIMIDIDSQSGFSVKTEGGASEC